MRLLKYCFLALVACILIADAAPGEAKLSKNLQPPFDTASVRATAGKPDNKKFKCERSPAPLRNLWFHSMYSKKEGNSSVIDPKAYAVYKKAIKPVAKFEVGLQAMANRYVRSNPPRADIAACSLEWLSTWARGGALLGDANKNGEFTRKWLLASIANAWMQIRDEPSLDMASRQAVLSWIHQVAEVVVKDYSRDENLKSRQNNHLYWAAWGVASAAMATGDRQLFEWAMDRARFGIGQIQQDGTLPLEVARGQRAYLYHLFAAMPLFMLANAGEKNGYNLFMENNNGLRRLADVCLNNLYDHSYFTNLTGKSQDLSHVTLPSDLGWLEIYARRYVDPRAEAALRKFRPVKHSRMGGNITLLYAGKLIPNPAKKK